MKTVFSFILVYSIAGAALLILGVPTFIVSGTILIFLHEYGILQKIKDLI